MSANHDILAKILHHKAEELVVLNERLSLRELSRQIEYAPMPRGFVTAIEHKVQARQPAVIAEIKKASPSKGLLCSEFDPKRLAQQYNRGGAVCLSVLTDEQFFQGSLNDLKVARSACDIPVLRKDFIIDPYQIYQARVAGADCILLIIAALGDPQLRELSNLALDLGLDVLVEVHDRWELERALRLDLPLLGINNRNLSTFHTDLHTTLDLLPHIPTDRVVVTESGIHTREHIATMSASGVFAFLIGESLVTQADPEIFLRQLISTPSLKF